MKRVWMRGIGVALCLVMGSFATACSESGASDDAGASATPQDVPDVPPIEDNDSGAGTGGQFDPDVADIRDPEGDTGQACTSSGQCDDADPCTDDACSNGSCVNTPIPGCATCTLSGEAGDVVDCAVHLARQSVDSPAAVALDFGVDYASDTARFLGLVDRVCPTEHCLEVMIPRDATELAATGHTVKLDAATPVEWAGNGRVSLGHLTVPEQALTDAYLDAGSVRGNSLLTMLRFELVVGTEGTAVTLGVQSALDASGASLPSVVSGDLLVTASPDDLCGGAVCSDGNPCTTDTCDSGTCTHSPTAGPCDDGNPCTVKDTCTEGVCEGDAAAAAGNPCHGKNLCTEVGTCDGSGGCDFDASLNPDCGSLAGPCADASCTATTGECAVNPKTGSCNDGDACTIDDTCDETGTCSGQLTDCDDGVGCTLDACIPGVGCQNIPDHGACDDSNVCTEDTCDPQSGCEPSPGPGGPCDDGDLCTLDDTCTDGVCVGDPDVFGCVCISDSDCGALEPDKCAGAFSCQGGICTLEPDSEVQCPPDGYQCQTGWSCNSDTGECEAAGPMDCDDGIECTIDTCSTSKGCLHNQVGLCPLGVLCAVSGSADDVVECELRLARGTLNMLPPTGADLRLNWEGTGLEFENLVDEFCFGGTCYPFDSISCAEDGTQCSASKLQTGHSLLLVPKDMADWTTWVSLTIIHQASVDTPVSDAVVEGDGGIPAAARVLKYRFRLTQTIGAQTPAEVIIEQASFDRVDAPLKYTIQPTPDGGVFVTGVTK